MTLYVTANCSSQLLIGMFASNSTQYNETTEGFITFPQETAYY